MQVQNVRNKWKLIKLILLQQKKYINLIYFIDLLLSMFGQGKATYPEMIVLAKVNANGIIEL